MRLKKLLGALHLATGFRLLISIWRVVDRNWFRTVYVFFVLDYGTREIVHAQVLKQSSEAHHASIPTP